jgi:hypothetical protein
VEGGGRRQARQVLGGNEKVVVNVEGKTRGEGEEAKGKPGSATCRAPWWNENDDWIGSVEGSVDVGGSVARADRGGCVAVDGCELRSSPVADAYPTPPITR